MPETRPSWYKGATGDWESGPLVPGAPPGIGLPGKATVQDTIRQLTGSKSTNDLTKGQPTNWSDFLKSLAVDAASQAPLAAITPGGTGKTLVRGAASLLAGTGADQLFTPSKPLADSLLDAGTNTAVGMAIPHALSSETHYSPPTIQGTGVSAPVLKLLNLINPSNWGSTPRTVMRGTVNGMKPVPRNIGDVISEHLFTKSNGKVDISPNAILNMFGFGTNAALDSTVNRPQGPSPDGQ